MEIVELPWGKVSLHEREGQLIGVQWMAQRTPTTGSPTVWAQRWRGRLVKCVRVGVKNPLEGVLFLHGTAFWQRVWQTIATIKRGEVLTYTQLAERAGSPTAVRAVATACGANPLPLIIPCHRVVAVGGLGGYSGLGGVELKKRLLEAEGVGFWVAWVRGFCIIRV